MEEYIKMSLDRYQQIIDLDKRNLKVSQELRELQNVKGERDSYKSLLDSLENGDTIFMIDPQRNAKPITARQMGVITKDKAVGVILDKFKGILEEKPEPPKIFLQKGGQIFPSEAEYYKYKLELIPKWIRKIFS